MFEPAVVVAAFHGRAQYACCFDLSGASPPVQQMFSFVLQSAALQAKSTAL